MSRIGKQPITVPAGVEVKIDADNVITVKGPKGTLTRKLHPSMDIKQDAGVITIEKHNENDDALQGLTRTLVNNMVVGVTEGFKKELEVNGVGYRVQKQGNKLIMNMGFSHTVEFEDQDGLTIEAPSQTSIIVNGIDKEKPDFKVKKGTKRLFFKNGVFIKCSNQSRLNGSFVSKPKPRPREDVM